MKKLLAICALTLPAIANANLECLPKQLNTIFTGVEYTSYHIPNVGKVQSWNCPVSVSASGVPLFRRQAFVLLDSFQLLPTCSSISMTALRKPEAGALTTVNNAIKACGKSPAAGTLDASNFTKLQTIGFTQPAQQLAKILELFPNLAR